MKLGTGTPMAKMDTISVPLSHNFAPIINKRNQIRVSRIHLSDRRAQVDGIYEFLGWSRGLNSQRFTVPIAVFMR